MKKLLILFSLILLMCSFVLTGCGGDELEYPEAEYLEDSEVIDDRDLTEDEYDEVHETSGGPGVVVANNDCADLAGTWILNTYTTQITAPAGTISQVHNNSGKTMILKDDCTYVEDYSTEGFVPARLTAAYSAQGVDQSQVSALIGSPVEDIVCSYSGQNEGEFTIDPSGNGFNTVKFLPNEVNQISGNCSPNVGGAMKVSGTHYTPGVGNTGVKFYEYLLDSNKLTLRSAFIPQTGTEVEITIVYTPA